jgi:hypothetical protein
MFNLYASEKIEKISKDKKLIEEKESKLKENRKSNNKLI